MTLVMVSIMSLLVLGCLQQVLMYYKASNILKNQHHRLLQIEKQLLDFANQDPKSLDPLCKIHGEVALDAIRPLILEEGCPISIDSHPFQYLIEELGEFACLTALTKKGRVSTYHRRFSILSLETHQMTQIRTFSPISLQPCLRDEHTIILGVSSWRFGQS